MADRRIQRPGFTPKQEQRVEGPGGFYLFKETVKGLPAASGEVAQGAARGFAASLGFGASLPMSAYESARQGKPTFVQPKFDPSQSKLSQTVFGDKEFTPTSEIVDLQDVFRNQYNPNRGKVTASTVPLGFALAAADIPTGGGASNTFKTIISSLKKFSRAGKAAKTIEAANRALRSAGISDDIIRFANLDRRVVSANTDADISRVFREAAQAETTFRETGRVPSGRAIPRTDQPVIPRPPTAPRPVVDQMKPPSPRVPRRVERPQTSRPTVAGDVPTPTSSVKQLQDNVIKKADETEFIREEVLPEVRSFSELGQFGRDTVAYTLDTIRAGDGIIPENIEANFRSIAGFAGLNTDKPLRELANDVAKVLDQNPEIAQGFAAPGDFFQKSTTIPGYLRRNNQAGFASVPEGFRNRKQTAAGRAVERRINKKVDNIDQLKDTTTGRNTEVVINEAAEKYAAIENIGLGDTAMSRLAQRAPSLGAGQLASDLLTPISSRLGRINPKLKFRLRKMEIETRRLTTERLNKVLPLMKATKKMSRKDKAVFDLALKNGDSATISAISSKYGIGKELDDAREMLDDVFKEAEGVGFEVSYREDFFPRQVKNPQAFSQYLRGRDDWGEIRVALEEKAEQLGKRFTDLTDDEIAGMTNNLLRGYGSQITLAKPGQLKSRKIEELGTELNKFYEDSNTALLTYVHKMTDEIEGRKFFGKEFNQKPVTKNPLTGEDAVFNTDDSIGAYVAKLVADGDITAKQQDEVTKILRARFKKGGMMGIVSAYRDLEYISTMGNPISAITQLGDLTFALYKNGWWNTLRGIGTTATRRGELTKESLGIERIAQEFDNPAKTSKVLEKVFKLVGMEQIDRLGKETFLEGSRLKLKTLASKNDPELVTDLNYMFDDIDAIKALEELKAGDITVRTKEVVMNRLLDIQPIAKSEMPVKYLEMPNGRVFYMLKSFTLKQYDIFRREAIDKIISGSKQEKIKGMRNLTYLAGLFVMANATTDEIKDFVLGRETSLQDRTIDNIFRLFGASKFDVYNSKERGIGFAVLQRILPPASVFDRIGTDITRLAEDKRYKTGPLEGERYGSEAVQIIPGGGKLYYWWFGRGQQKEQYQQGSSGTTNDSGRVRSISRPGQETTSSRVRKIERP